jgi:DNA-directed RNA polymerase specialized sigma24 family protein
MTPPRMTERQREVWHLRHRRGLPPRMIARRLEISLPSVFRLLARARTRGPASQADGPQRRWVRVGSLHDFHEF